MCEMSVCGKQGQGSVFGLSQPVQIIVRRCHRGLYISITIKGGHLSEPVEIAVRLRHGTLSQIPSGVSQAVLEEHFTQHVSHRTVEGENAVGSSVA